MAIAVEQGKLDIARVLVNREARPVLEFPPKFTPSQWALKFFQDQIAYRARGDWEGIMRDFWNDDCTMVSFDFVLKGKESIKQHFIEGNKAAGKLIGFAVDSYKESPELILMRATVLSEFVLTKGYDTYLFRNGKVSLLSAMTIPSGRTLAWAKKWLFDEYLESSVFNPISPRKQ